MNLETLALVLRCFECHPVYLDTGREIEGAEAKHSGGVSEASEAFEHFVWMIARGRDGSMVGFDCLKPSGQSQISQYTECWVRESSSSTYPCGMFVFDIQNRWSWFFRSFVLYQTAGCFFKCFEWTCFHQDIHIIGHIGFVLLVSFCWSLHFSMSFLYWRAESRSLHCEIDGGGWGAVIWAKIGPKSSNCIARGLSIRGLSMIVIWYPKQPNFDGCFVKQPFFM